MSRSLYCQDKFSKLNHFAYFKFLFDSTGEIEWKIERRIFLTL